MDVFLYKLNPDALAGSPDYFNQAHRFVAFLGNDNRAYVLDPIRGNGSTSPQLLEEYRRKACVDNDVYYSKYIYISEEVKKEESEVKIGTGKILNDGLVTVTIPAGTVITDISTESQISGYLNNETNNTESQANNETNSG